MKRLEALEGLRGYAAFLVFLTHAFGLLAAKLYGVDADRYAPDAAAPPALAAILLLFRSFYGVDLFFVLSGLLMADIALRRWPGTPRFLARRALRIYPPFLVTLAIVLVAAAVFFAQAHPVAEIAGNVAFLQGFNIPGIAPINPVTWSLSFEAVFYLLVPVLALAWSRPAGALGGKAPLVLLAAFAALVALAAWLPGAKSVFLAYFALFVPGIYLGMLDPEARRALARRIPALIAVGAWAAFEIAVKLEWLVRSEAIYYAVSGIAAGLLVMKACDDASGLARALSRRTMLWLGRYSYSFFLVHYVVLHLFAGLLDATLGRTHAALYGFVLVAGGLALSLAAARLLFAATERFYFERR